METILRWAVAAILAFVGNRLAALFSGSCPADPGAFVCQHWEGIATIAGAVLGVFGYKVVRAKTQQQSALTATTPRPPLAPSSNPRDDAGQAEPNVELPLAPRSAEDQVEIDKANQRG
jgi:hypothetical protein